MQALFISDLHLTAEHPQTLTALDAFLAGPAHRADHLFVLGDLFEYWAGDDDDSSFNNRVAAAFRNCADRGTQIRFLAGNRDFLLGSAFACRAGMELIPDPYLFVCGELRLLLSHGDQLCTDDASYQAYRKQVRDPAWQAAFLARPLSERKAFIVGLREHSTREKGSKASAIMDVNDDAVRALLRAYDYPVLIHGHTHRPARHQLEVDGRDCERHVLAEWDAHAHYLHCDGRKLAAFSCRSD